MKLFKRKQKKTAKDYVGKNISFYEYRNGMGIMFHDMWVGEVTESVGDSTIIMRNPLHKSLGSLGKKAFSMHQIRIIDEE